MLIQAAPFKFFLEGAHAVGAERVFVPKSIAGEFRSQVDASLSHIGIFPTAENSF